MSLPRKAKQREKKKKKKDELPICNCTWAFLSIEQSIFFLQFSLYFREKTFWWARRKNIWTLLFIFLPPYPTKYTPKKFSFPFSLKSFASTLFHLQINTPYESNQIEKKNTHTHTNLKTINHANLPFTLYVNPT